MSEGGSQAHRTSPDQHLPTPRGERKPLQIHHTTIEQVKNIRDSMNAASDGNPITTDDVIRLALLSLGALDETAGPDAPDMSDETAAVIDPFIEHLVDATDPQVLSGEERDSTDSRRSD